jgi:hypothetical protein
LKDKNVRFLLCTGDDEIISLRISCRDQKQNLDKKKQWLRLNCLITSVSVSSRCARQRVDARHRPVTASLPFLFSAGRIGLGLAIAGGVVNSMLYNGKVRACTRTVRSNVSIVVDGGQRAVIFDRFQGIKPDVIGEGTHFMIPWLHKPIIFDIRTRPRSIPSVTGTKGGDAHAITSPDSICASCRRSTNDQYHSAYSLSTQSGNPTEDLHQLGHGLRRTCSPVDYQ